MENFWQHLQSLADAHSIISLGFYALLVVIFAETGVFFGFFLPGDYLLFMSGLLCSSKQLNVSIFTLIISLIAAGTLGNFAGYWFGYRAGIQLFTKKNSFFFKTRHIELARAFYSRYGGIAIVLGRFFPIIRTFAPIFAGIVKVDIKKFSFYNFIGSIAWVCTFTLSGYFLGQRFPELKNYLEYIILGLIVITSVPLVITYFRVKLHTTENIE